MYLVLPLLLPIILVVDFSTADKPLLRRDVNQSQSKNRKEQIFEERASEKQIMPREYIRFELSDAKVPDEHQQQFFLQQRQKQLQLEQQKAFPQKTQTQTNQQSTEENQASQQAKEPTKPARRRKQQQARRGGKSPTKGKEQPQNKSEKNSGEQDTSASTLDMAAVGSRLLKIAHPSPTSHHDKRQRSVKELPFGVQKAINHALQQDFNNIPYLDSIKYYIKDPAPKTTAYTYTVNSNNRNAILSSNSASREWWQLPPLIRTTPQTVYGVPVKSSIKVASNLSTSSLNPQPTPSASPPVQMGNYLAYPVYKGLPVQYSLNASPSLLNSLPSTNLGQYYNDRFYPSIYGKPSDSLLSDEIKATPLPFTEDLLGDLTKQQNGVSSTSPILFPVTQPPNIPAPIVNFYAAVPKELKEFKDLNVRDKDTLALVKTAIESLKKNNPHLDVVPKKVENNELIVHVTPKPEYLQTPDSAVQSVTDKNLLYLNKYTPSSSPPTNVVKVIEVTARPILKKPNEIEHSHAYVKQIPETYENEFGYAFGYRVHDHHTGTDFGHTQKRMTDGTTHGEYKILMPDGRTQNVKYKADDQGYHADVSYDMRK